VEVNCLENRGRNALECANFNKHGQREGIAKRFKEKGVMGTKTKYFKMNAFIHRGKNLLLNRIFKYGFVLK
jgi:hypothetical protein